MLSRLKCFLILVEITDYLVNFINVVESHGYWQKYQYLKYRVIQVLLKTEHQVDFFHF